MRAFVDWIKTCTWHEILWLVAVVLYAVAFLFALIFVAIPAWRSR